MNRLLNIFIQIRPKSDNLKYKIYLISLKLKISFYILNGDFQSNPIFLSTLEILYY